MYYYVPHLLMLFSTLGNQENKAIALALADIRTIPQHHHKYIRYVWIADNDHETYQCVAFAMNLISQEQNIHRPLKLSHEKTTICRLDLRTLATGKALETLTHNYEEFRFDPRFNLLLTKDTIKFAGHIKEIKQPRKEWKIIDIPPTRYSDGKIYTRKWVEEEVNADVGDVVRVIGEHIDRHMLAELIDRTQSQAPIICHNYFIFRSMSTIQDEGLYKTLFGGLYYELAGIPKNSKKGTDKDNLLEQLGVGNVDSGITAKEIFAKLRSDQRTAVFKSGVTGSSRAIQYLRTLAGRESQGLAVFTLDVKRQSIDIGQQAMMNLLEFKQDGSEGIFEKPNGLQGFVIYDGQDKLLQAVGSNIAVDRTVPIPHSTDLHAPISCLRCHGPEGGWRISRNDVKKLTSGNFDILRDRNFKDQDDVYARLAGLYSGDLELRVLPRARDDYAAATLRATGMWKGSKDQTDIVKLVSAKIGKIYNDYAYVTVDAKTVLRDLGHTAEVKDNDEAAKILTKLLPPVPIGQYYGIEEDPRIKALCRGMDINPIADYALTYAFIARRAQIYGDRK